MTERQMFGAIVRGVGVYVAVNGIEQMWMVLARLLSLSPDMQFRFTLMQDFLYSSTLFAVSYLLIRKPQSIINFAYEPEIESDRMPN